MKLYVINLDRSKDRLEHVTTVFSKVGLSFDRVSAVDGRALPDEEFKRLTSVRNWPLELTRTEVGCFLSHRECLRLIAEGDDHFGAIFEDDIILSPKAALFLENWDWIPEGVDIVKIDTAEIDCLIGPVSAKLSAGYRLAPLISKHYCAGGYIVSKDCARRLYELTEYATAPIDEIYFNPDCGVLQTLDVQQMFPAPVIQAGLVSTIRGPKEPDQPRMKKKRIKKPKHLRSQLPFSQKVVREIKRIGRRHIQPIWVKWLSPNRWGKIAFK